ncbi:MAG: prolipoprotein diacylglyceryl transferase [Chloroflexi bacterium]|nr:prolipoprotein diacylglyceryl transferase [Chloroflexota bacterium]
MITIGIDPVIVQIGHFAIRWYSLMIVTAIIVGTYVGLKETRRKGIPDDDVYSFLTWGIIGGIVGARLLHVIDKLDYYLRNPIQIIAFQEGGLAILGAVGGALIVLVAYSRFRNLPMAKVADAGAIGMILGQAVGRIGCMFNGDVIGTVTNVPWAVAYTHPNSLTPELGVPRHPAAAYELVWDLIIFAFLWSIRKKRLADGTMLFLYGSLYSLGRFFITFFRVDQPIWMGLSQAQVLSIVLVVVMMPVAVYLNLARGVPSMGARSGGGASAR